MRIQKIFRFRFSTIKLLIFIQFMRGSLGLVPRNMFPRSPKLFLCSFCCSFHPELVPGYPCASEQVPGEGNNKRSKGTILGT